MAHQRPFADGSAFFNPRHTGRPLAHYRSAGDAAAIGVQRPQQFRPRIYRPDHRRRHHRRPPVAFQLCVYHFDLPSRWSQGSKRYAKSRRHRPGIRSVPPAIWFLDFLQPTNRSSGQSTTDCHWCQRLRHSEERRFDLSLRIAQRRGNLDEAEHTSTNRRCYGDEIATLRSQ